MMKSLRRMGALSIGGVLATFAIIPAVLSRPQSKVRLASSPPILTRASSTSQADTRQDADKRPLAFYLGNMRADLFTAPKPIPPAPLPERPAIKPVRVEPKAPPPAPPDPFANYIYSGSVTIDGQIEALIEDDLTREGWYIKPGDSFQGASVVRIDIQNVTLNVDGRLRLLAKSSADNLVPLNTSARVEQPVKGGPGSPASGQQGSGGPSDFGGPFGPRSFGGPGGPGDFRGGPGGFGGPGGPGMFRGPGGFGGPGGPPDFGGPGGPPGPGGFGGPPPP